MIVRSLAWRTDLALLAQSGSTVEDAGDHVVVRTAANPAFHWGNFLLLDGPPDTAAVPGWLDRFASTFPEAQHVAIGMDAADGTTDDLAPLAAAGLAPDVSAVLTCHEVAPPPTPPARVVLRPLAGDDDWAQRAALPPLLHPDEGPGHAEFVRRRSLSERARCEAGHGAWFGAFEDGVLLSALGLFDAGDGLARYQDVETRPDAERRGLAGALIHTAAEDARARHGSHTFVIVADPTYGAIRLYRRLGFEPTEVQLGADRSSAQRG